MKNMTFALFSLVLLVTLSLALPAHAQQSPTTQYSLWDVQHRLSVGGRLYRSFDERPGIAGSYSSNWWAGIPAAYILTGRYRSDGSINPIPLSVIGALDIGLSGPDKKRTRGYIGLTALFKGTD